jgi:hypothetical protein
MREYICLNFLPFLIILIILANQRKWPNAGVEN